MSKAEYWLEFLGDMELLFPAGDELSILVSHTLSGIENDELSEYELEQLVAARKDRTAK